MPQARELHKKFLFKVFVSNPGGPWRAEFVKMTGMKWTTANIEYYEGGALVPENIAGRTKFDPVTLSRGVTTDMSLYEWCLQVTNAVRNMGLVESQHKRQVTLFQYNREQVPVRRWQGTNAYPTVFTPGEWDNTVDELTMEEITLQADYWRPVALAGSPVAL